MIRLMNMGKADIDATLQLSESRGDVEIMSRPVLWPPITRRLVSWWGVSALFVQVSRLLPTDNNNPGSGNPIP